MNPTFKQAQLLPALTPEMFAAKGSQKAFCPFCASIAPRRVRRLAATPAESRRLPRLPDRSNAEIALLAMLTLSAVFCIGQAVITVIQLTPQWPMFETWVAQLLG